MASHSHRRCAGLPKLVDAAHAFHRQTGTANCPEVASNSTLLLPVCPAPALSMAIVAAHIYRSTAIQVPCNIINNAGPGINLTWGACAQLQTPICIETCIAAFRWLLVICAFWPQLRLSLQLPGLAQCCWTCAASWQPKASQAPRLRCQRRSPQVLAWPPAPLPCSRDRNHAAEVLNTFT